MAKEDYICEKCRTEEEVGKYQISVSADGNGNIYEVVINTKNGDVVYRTKSTDGDFRPLPTQSSKDIEDDYHIRPIF